MTKLVVIEIIGAESSLALEDESLPHFRQLLQIGCFGSLNANAIAVHEMLVWVFEQKSKGQPVLVTNIIAQHAESAPESATDSNAVQVIRRAVQATEWACLHITAQIGESERDHQRLDGELGDLLEWLDDDTAILVVATSNRHANFVLAPADDPTGGALERVQLADLWFTISRLMDLQVPDGVQGKALMHCGSPAENARLYTVEDEEIIHERLAGLGYIG